MFYNIINSYKINYCCMTLKICIGNPSGKYFFEQLIDIFFIFVQNKICTICNYMFEKIVLM